MSIIENKSVSILDWYKHYAKQIDEMYFIYTSHLKRMDKFYVKHDDDYMYKNFVVYLYNNSPHVLYRVDEDEIL